MWVYDWLEGILARGMGRGEAPETVIVPVQIYGITLDEEAMARARARRGGGEQDDSFVGANGGCSVTCRRERLGRAKGALSAPTPSAESVVINGSEKEQLIN